MPSPFPGMDPWLENPMYWGGIHARLCVAIATELNRRLPDRWYAEIDEYVWLQTDDDQERKRFGKPDTFVSQKNGTHPATSGGGGVAVLSVPAPAVTTTLPTPETQKHRFVKIVGPDHHRVVTVVEILSPANKASKEGRAKYLSKREDYFTTGTNLVEIDLLRDGDRMPMGQPSPPSADHYTFVCRAGQYPQADVWAYTVRDAIPPIPIPLGPSETEAVLDLGPLLADIYDTNRHSSRIDYRAPPVPGLRTPDAEWAAGWLAGRPEGAV